MPGHITYGRLADLLAARNLAIHNLASLPHISLAGAIATGTHGSGVANGNLATAVSGVEMVTSSGEVVSLTQDSDDFWGSVVSLGALGAVTNVTLEVEPEFAVTQHVFEQIPWKALLGDFHAAMGAGYSVSVFTRWGEDVEQVWVKRRVDDPTPAANRFLWRYGGSCEPSSHGRAGCRQLHPTAGCPWTLVGPVAPLQDGLHTQRGGRNPI